MDSPQRTSLQSVLPLNASPSPRLADGSCCLHNITSTSYGFPSSVPRLSPPPRSPSRPTSPRLDGQENDSKDPLVKSSSSSSSPVRQSPRRHAHRRSAAISHDFDIEGLSVINPTSRSLNTTQEPEHDEPLVTSPSSRNFSFPSGHTKHQCLDERPTKVAFSPSVEYIPRHTPAVSEASCSATPASPIGDDHGVSFAVEPLKRLNNSNDTSASLSMTSLPIPDLVQYPHDKPEPPSPSMPTRRHKKVKSWAGNIIRFRSKKPHGSKSSHHQRRASDIEQRSSIINIEEQSFESSSYIKTSMLASPPPDESHEDDSNDVFIDLDAALGLFSDDATPKSSRDHFAPIFRKHRRSESAPEMSVINEDEFGRFSNRHSSSRAGSRGMKRKMSAVLEESEDQVCGKENNSPSDISTLSSIPSESAIPLTPDMGVGEVIMEDCSSSSSSSQDNQSGIASRYPSISCYPPISDDNKTIQSSDEGLGLILGDSEFSTSSSSTKLSHFRSRSYTSRQHHNNRRGLGSNDMDYNYDFRHHSRSLSKPYDKPYPLSSKRGNINTSRQPNPSSSMSYFDEVPKPQQQQQQGSLSPVYRSRRHDDEVPMRHSRALSLPNSDKSFKFGEPGPEVRGGGNSQISLLNVDNNSRKNYMSRSTTSLTSSTNSSSLLNTAALKIKRSVSLRRLSRSISGDNLHQQQQQQQHISASHDDRSMTSKLWRWIKRKV